MRTLAVALLITCAAPVAAQAAPPAATAHRHTWYVSAAASGQGDGTRGAPFSTLAAVEAASREGDRIVVLASPLSTPALNGGIRLKARQRLVGSGPAVTGSAAAQAAPRLTNTDKTRLDGDAVRLASGTTVRNLRIAGTVRGALYGLGIRSATLIGNDVSGQNTSCTPGFHIPPFNVPLLIPGAGVPISNGLHNGWAGILIDAPHGTTQLTISDNHVHNANCGDGIDIRAYGSSTVRATVARNDVRELRQGSSLESILAIGLQTREHARMVARLEDNTEAGLGNDEDFGTGPSGADSEGIFVNPVDASKLRVRVLRNTYTHTPGRGGFSANGLEFVSMGNGGSGLVDVRDSRFSGPPGDVVEQLALGTDARLRLRLDRVTATASTGFSGTGVGDTVVIPGNDGDCLVAASGGAGNTIDLVIRRSALTNCANNGITFGSAVANGSGPTKELRLDIDDSTITGNHDGNLRVANVTDLQLLSVKVQHTNLGGSRGVGSSPANLAVENLGTTRSGTIDLGGGPLGSAGGNCLQSGNLAALVINHLVHARGDWWGTAGGPGPGRVVALGGSIDSGAPLASAPAGC